MPRKPIDYSKTVMYKIVCNDLAVTDCYVGSTTDFICRKNEHKHACNISTKTNHHLKIYQTIRANGGWENWSMIEIEKFSCQDKNEATERERYWFETLNANMNTVNPNRSNLEREHTEKYKKSRKAWYETNKEKVLERQKQYKTKKHLEIINSLGNV